jgi:GNAT superfamily N-acetyltransferase
VSGGRATDGIRAIRLSQAAPAERRALLAAYEREVYRPAFPDAEIREDPSYWLNLLESDPWPDPPQPLLDVILMVDGTNRILGGVTIELYRAATFGFLTYVAVGEAARGQGLGRRLVAAARAWLDAVGGPDVPMLAETERYQDANDDEERAATVLRQRRLAGLGARMVDFDYVMPPLRPGLNPHRLHMMIFGGPTSVPGARVLGLLEELAHALGTGLGHFEDTRTMAAALAEDPVLAVKPLPMANGS